MSIIDSFSLGLIGMEHSNIEASSIDSKEVMFLLKVNRTSSYKDFLGILFNSCLVYPFLNSVPIWFRINVGKLAKLTEETI